MSKPVKQDDAATLRIMGDARSATCVYVRNEEAVGHNSLHISYFTAAEHVICTSSSARLMQLQCKYSVPTA